MSRISSHDTPVLAIIEIASIYVIRNLWIIGICASGYLSVHFKIYFRLECLAFIFELLPYIRDLRVRIFQANNRNTSLYLTKR